MRRFTLFFALLLSITLGAVAQNVAENPTTFDDLQSGYYVMQRKTSQAKQSMKAQ